MIKQKSAQIYLATARGKQQNIGYNCWSTFNFGDYFEEFKKEFGSLFLLNYHVLGPKKSTTIVCQTNSLNYILPLYGRITLKDEQQEDLILTEQIQQIASKTATSLELSNHFDKNISFIQIGFKFKTTTSATSLLAFDFKKKNKLIPLFKNQTATAYITQFDVRKEGYYPLKNKENGIFVYIIQGAFEFENILLETGDALSIKETEDVEWESLSKNAMLLLLEISLT